MASVPGVYPAGRAACSCSLVRRRRPRGTQSVERGIGDSTPLVERDPEDVERLCRPTDADSDDESSAAEPVDRGGRVRQVCRMPVATDQHSATEANGLGLTREPRQRRQAFVEG